MIFCIGKYMRYSNMGYSKSLFATRNRFGSQYLSIFDRFGVRQFLSMYLDSVAKLAQNNPKT